MRLVTCVTLTSFSICIFSIISQNVSSSSPVSGLTLFGTTLAAWNILSNAATAHSARSGDRNKEKKEDDKSTKHQLIDNILKKAEIEKVKQTLLSPSTAPSADAELDPVKCFPKALCGVSSEVEQISKRKKNGLIAEYLILMKAVTRHPEFLEDMVSTSSKTKVVSQNKKNKGKDKPQSDVASNDDNSGSEEDDENDDSDEEEDEEDEQADDVDNGYTIKKIKKKKKTGPPKNDEEFHKAYLREKIEMDKLLKETMQKDEKDRDKLWWDDSRPPDNGPWNRPRPQSPPSRPWGYGGGGGGGGGGYRPTRPNPLFRRDNDEAGDEEPPANTSNFGIGGISGISSFFSNLFGFGDTSLTNDGWFQNAARDLSGEVAPGIAVDETREILETAMDIGKSFDKPSQCNEIFNACQFEYTELLYMIDDLRKNVRALVKQSESQGNQKKTKGKKKENAKSELSSNNNSKTKSKAGRRRKPEKVSLSSTSSEISGEVPDERYVIPVTPPQSGFSDSLAFSNILSWLGLGGGGREGSY